MNAPTHYRIRYLSNRNIGVIISGCLISVSINIDAEEAIIVKLAFQTIHGISVTVTVFSAFSQKIKTAARTIKMNELFERGLLL